MYETLERKSQMDFIIYLESKVMTCAILQQKLNEYTNTL